MEPKMNSISWLEAELEVVSENTKSQIVTCVTVKVDKIYFEDGFVVPMS